MKRDEIKEALRKQALDYHEFPVPGKLSVTATKQLLNQSDLALAYSPGVAAACEAIVEIRSTCFDLPRAAIWSASSATAPPCSGSEPLVLWRPSR